MKKLLAILSVSVSLFSVCNLEAQVTAEKVILKITRGIYLGNTFDAP